MDFAVLALFFAFFSFIVYRLIRYGGPRGALFASGIDSTLGKVSVANSYFEKLNLEVHRLRSNTERKWVGVQFNTRRGTSWQFLPLTLSREEALQLSDLLRKAAE